MTTLSRRTLLQRAMLGAAAAVPLSVLGPATLVHGGVRSAPPEPASAYDAATLLPWLDELLGLIRTTPGYSPPVAARAIGYTGVTLYEALLPGMPRHRSLAGLLSGLEPLPARGRNAAYAWPVVAGAAMAEALRGLFPTAAPERLANLARLEETIAASAPRGVRERSIDRGREIAGAVHAWSTTDGGHEGYLRNVQPGYEPPVGPGLWVPTPPAFLPALQPAWGGNRTFLPDAASCAPGPPPPYSTDPESACFAEAIEVYDAVNALTDEQRTIARFWADDPGATATPPGHSLSILAQVLRATGADLATAAEAVARLGIAVSDAFVECWRAKYTYNLLRPITYVRQTIDPAWGDPLPVGTPPFPEYTSGHSVQSSAAAAVLTAQFGTVAFVDHTHDALGLAPRSFASFEAAAAEAAISRLYGGIHFRSAIDRGLDQGRCIGQRVARLTLAA